MKPKRNEVSDKKALLLESIEQKTGMPLEPDAWNALASLPMRALFAVEMWAYSIGQMHLGHADALRQFANTVAGRA